MRHLFLLVLFLLAPLVLLHSAQEPDPRILSAARIAELRSDAEQGIAEAQNNLGVLYESGQGLAQDYVEARKWFLKAAEQGHALAQYNLGVLYAYGLGVAQDYTIAYGWYHIAAAQGNSEVFRDAIAAKLNTASLAEAQKLSRKYFKLYVEPFQ